ncbi:MAG: HU family DNA-binding protein [Muribaculum sp.]|nr:HU family DNA-binding protein [Muribaculum sp.]
MDNRMLMDKVAQRMDTDVEKVAALTAGLCEVITDVLQESDTVAIPTFGNLEPKKRMERISVHPASGKRLLIPPKIVVGFKPSTILKSKLKASEGGDI